MLAVIAELVWPQPTMKSRYFFFRPICLVQGGFISGPLQDDLANRDPRVGIPIIVLPLL